MHGVALITLSYNLPQKKERSVWECNRAILHYHIILTKECNLACNYCGGGSDTPPKEIQYPILDLKQFLSSDSDPVLAFYGGEPLLRIKTMENIMDQISARFVLQTNGLFLDRIQERYLERFHTILVSIDGTEEVTDRERGSGIYNRVLRNLELLRQRGFSGDLVARMTVAQGTDIYHNVQHLLSLGYFDHVHWQLDFSMFWAGYEENCDEEGKKLAHWIDSYNSGISALVNQWVNEMASLGRISGLVPFIGIMNSLISGRQARLRCGSGVDFFSIMPDGRISACPVSLDYDFSIVGSILESTPGSLYEDNKARIGEPCLSCDIFHVCGGRCLLVNRMQEMLKKDGYSQICSTVKHLVSELKDSALPRVQELIENRTISRSDFEYPELNNGCEIIP